MDEAFRSLSRAQTLLALSPDDPEYSCAVAQAIEAITYVWICWGIALDELALNDGQRGRSETARKAAKQKYLPDLHGKEGQQKQAAKIAIKASWDSTDSETRSRRGWGAKFDRTMSERYAELGIEIGPETVKKWREGWARSRI
jgi:hypothetical protein